MVKLATENVPQAEITLIDGKTLPYADGEFDLVKTCTVLQHDPEEFAEAMIGEICRVADKFVVLFEDTEDRETPKKEGTGKYQNYFGRSTSWYAEQFKKHGFVMTDTERLQTYASLRVFNFLNRTVSRRRAEGTPYGRTRIVLEKAALVFSKEIDRYVPSRNWELTSMLFEKERG